jgi:hypothetical protein
MQNTITSHEINFKKLETDNETKNERIKVLEEINQELSKLTLLNCKKLENKELDVEKNPGQIKAASVFPQETRTDRNYREKVLIIRNKLNETKSAKKFTKSVKRCPMFHRCAGSGNTKMSAKGSCHRALSSCPLKEEVVALKLANNQGIMKGK